MKHILFFLILSVLAFLPTYLQEKQAPADTFYPLIHKEPADYYSYLSIIKQGRNQNKLMNQYSARDLPLSLLHSYYLLLGKAGKLLSLSDIVMYRIGMYVPLMLYIFYAWRLTSLLIPDKYKWFAIFVIFFASPFPKENLTIFGMNISLEPQWWTQLDAYSRISLKPHHFMATSLMLASVYYFLKYIKSRKLGQLILTGILMEFSLIFFAMPAFILFVSLAFLSLIKIPLRKPKMKEIAVVLIFFISILLTFLFINTEAKKLDLIAWESARLNAPQDSVWQLSLYFFLPLGIMPLFFIPAVFFIRQKQKLFYLPPLLIVVTAYLLFILSAKGIVPLPMIRLIYYAPYVFAGLTAVMGMIYLVEKISGMKWKRIAVISFCFLFVINALWGLKSYWWPEVTKKEIYINTYIPGRYLKAMEFLDQNSPLYSNVMSTFYTGMFIPAFTHNKVYIGHEAVPDDFNFIWWTAKTFMDGKFSQEEAKKILSDNRIAYIFWDQGELPPEYSTLMKPIFSKEGITIFMIN